MSAPSTMSDETTIRVRDLHVEFNSRGRRVRALNGVDLDIRRAETVAIIGRSGAGKTTLLRVLAGLQEPTQGSVEVAGHTVDRSTANRRAFRRDVGLVFQNYGLVPQLTALQNVLCGRLYAYPAAGALLRFRGEDKAAARRHLDRLGLGERLGTRSSRLSGGEQQRVGIARLLLQNPRVALLDEPIASLDVHAAEAVLQELRRVDEAKVTTVVVLHDLEMVRRWADRVLVVERGEIVFDGPPDEGCAQLEGDLVYRHQREAARDELPQRAEPDAPASLAPTVRPSVPPTDRPGLGRMPFYALIIAGLLGSYVWAIAGLDLELSKIFGSFDNAADFLDRMVPVRENGLRSPDLEVVPTILGSLVETIQMALIGTTLAAVLSLPAAAVAARNVSPMILRAPARVVLNLMRTVPSIIWGLFFVAIVGLGPLPGILALTFYASGYLGKFYYEGIESIDPGPGIALKAAGASRAQLFRYGVFPQVLPLLLGYTLYMFEYNVRAASILGIVGAGGIGFYLYSYVNNFNYDKAATAILLLLVAVTLIDAASSKLRAWLQD